MLKKLPSIYHDKNKVKKTNNRIVFYSSRSDILDNQNNALKKSTKNGKDYNHIINTLNSLFTSSHHVFMIPVEVVTKGKVYDTKIIYRDKVKISTIDGDTIFIKDIIDIKIKKSL